MAKSKKSNQSKKSKKSASKAAGRSSPPQSAQERRVQNWLARHPGADNPDSAHYRPNWRQESRGHKPHEHATRAMRSRAAGRLESSTKQSDARFARRQAKRAYDEEGLTPRYREQLDRVALVHGKDKVEELKAWVAAHKAVHRERRRTSVTKGGKRFRGELTGRSRYRDEMEALAAKYGIDWELLYYH